MSSREIQSNDPTHYLIFDTCVWVELAVSEFSLVAKLARLINDNKARIILPELVMEEWENCKEPIRKQIHTNLVDARRSAKLLASYVSEISTNGGSEDWSSVNPDSMGRQLADQRIQAIDDILYSDSSIDVATTDRAKFRAVELALAKKAPFRSKNSMSDALIFLSAIEWVNETKPDNAFFVTLNTSDFSDKKCNEEDHGYEKRLSPDLEALVDSPSLKYKTVTGRVLNEIEEAIATDEEVKRGEVAVFRTRIADDFQTFVNSSKAIADFLKRQECLNKQLSGDTLNFLAREQEKFAAMVSRYQSEIDRSKAMASYLQEAVDRATKSAAIFSGTRIPSNKRQSAQSNSKLPSSEQKDDENNQDEEP